MLSASMSSFFPFYDFTMLKFIDDEVLCWIFFLLFCYQVKFKGGPKVGNNICVVLWLGWKL
jgi:hypothetical protein